MLDGPMMLESEIYGLKWSRSEAAEHVFNGERNIEVAAFIAERE